MNDPLHIYRAITKLTKFRKMTFRDSTDENIFGKQYLETARVNNNLERRQYNPSIQFTF